MSYMILNAPKAPQPKKNKWEFHLIDVEIHTGATMRIEVDSALSIQPLTKEQKQSIAFHATPEDYSDDSEPDWDMISSVIMGQGVDGRKIYFSPTPAEAIINQYYKEDSTLLEIFRNMLI